MSRIHHVAVVTAIWRTTTSSRIQISAADQKKSIFSAARGESKMGLRITNGYWSYNHSSHSAFDCWRRTTYRVPAVLSMRGCYTCIVCQARSSSCLYTVHVLETPFRISSTARERSLAWYLLHCGRYRAVTQEWQTVREDGLLDITRVLSSGDGSETNPGSGPFLGCLLQWHVQW